MLKKGITPIVLSMALLLTFVGCGGNPSNTSLAPGNSPMQIDLTDLEGLKESYMLPILYSGATRITWSDPNIIQANSLIDMYGYMNVWNADIAESEMETIEDVPYYFLDEAILEDYVQGYFSVSTEHLRFSDQYSAERNAYGFNMSGVGFSYSPTLLRAEFDDTTKTLILYLDGGYDFVDREYTTLTIQLNSDGSFRYIGNVYSESEALDIDISETEIIEMVERIMQKGNEIFWWYHGDWEHMEIDTDDHNWIREDGKDYAKVGIFGTMAELKTATEAVFTIEFCETHFYSKINEYQQYHEIDGVLYANTQSGGMGWIFGLPKEYTVETADSDTIVLIAVCGGLDRRPEFDGETEYEFDIVLKNADGEWRLNNWYSHVPEGYPVIDVILRDEAQ